MTDKSTPAQILADQLFADAAARLQYQHEYTIAGLKTLFLINGGAVIGLLTFLGNSDSGVSAHKLGVAFAWYIGGVAAAVFTYLTAYSSQAQLMNGSMIGAYHQLGVSAETTKTRDDFNRVGMRYVFVGVAMAILSLVCFGLGSTYAREAVVLGRDSPPITTPAQAAAERKIHTSN